MSGIHDPDDLPNEMEHFVASQYERFGIPVPPKELMREAMWFTFQVVDYFDPYALFFGLTDVEVTEDWAYHTYDIRDVEGGIEEADPELMETFALKPDQDVKQFNYFMNEPGLKHKDLGVGEMIDENLSGFLHHEGDAYSITSERNQQWIDARSPVMKEQPKKPAMKDILVLCTVWDDEYRKHSNEWQEKEPTLQHYLDWKAGSQEIDDKGLFSKPKVQEYFEVLAYNKNAFETRLDYFRLGSWAALMWLISPMARQFRENNYDMIHLCYKHGEALMYGGSFLKFDSYKKLSRPPQSCVACGLASWCVEMTFLHGEHRNLCEFHLNGELPKMAPVTCGTKVCRFAECPHHPLHNVEGGRGLAYRQSGHLKTMVQQNQNYLGNSKQRQELLN